MFFLFVFLGRFDLLSINDFLAAIIDHNLRALLVWGVAEVVSSLSSGYLRRWCLLCSGCSLCCCGSGSCLTNTFFYFLICRNSLLCGRVSLGRTSLLLLVLLAILSEKVVQVFSVAHLDISPSSVFGILGVFRLVRSLDESNDEFLDDSLLLTPIGF